jgi:outer membrane protein assembly factor BamB
VVADRFVFTFAPDGTVRSSVELLGRVEGPVMVRSDGSAVVVGGATRTSVEYTLLSSTGDPVGVRAPGAIMTFERAHLADDRIAATDGRALVFLDLRGELTRTATLPNLRHLAPLGAGLAMSTERSLFVADANGVVSSQLTLPDAPLWLAPLGSHRLGVALPGSLPQLWIIDHHGVVTARVRVPPSTSSPLVDPTGAVLLASRAGTVVCLAPDGNERWRLTTTDVLRPPAAPLPRGGVAFATEGTSLLLFTEGP